MKYILVAEDSIAEALSKLVLNELARFDVRSEIKEVVAKKKQLAKNLKEFKPDLVIVIGSKKSYALVQMVQKARIRSCFFYQSLLDKAPLKISASPLHKIYFDVTVNPEGEGSILSDFIRQTDMNGEESYDRPQILIAGFKASQAVNKMKERYSAQKPDIDFEVVDVSEDLEIAVKKASESNAFIATDHFSCMLAVFVNCPMLNIYPSSLLSIPSNKEPIINKLLGKEVVKSYPVKDTKSIILELNKILHDHQYSAGMMEDYQQLKSELGNQPFIRQTVQEIINWVEDTN